MPCKSDENPANHYDDKESGEMTDMLFDTQRMVERLESVGVPRAQARMHTVLLAEAISAVETTIIERCASKQDLAEGFLEMRAAIDKLDARVDTRLAGVDTKLAGVDTKLARVDTKLAGGDIKLAGVDTKLARVDTKLAGGDIKLAGVDTKLAGVDVKLAGVDAKIAGVDARMAELKTEMIRLVVSVGILQTALIAALVLKLAP
jgi:chromosome segregation ATPase